MACPEELRVQLCQRKMRRPTLPEWRRISAFALLLIPLSPSFSTVIASTNASSEMRRGGPPSVRIPAIDGDDIRFSGCPPLKDCPKPKLLRSYRTIKDSSGSGLNMVWIGTTDMNSRCSYMILLARTACAVFFIHSLFKDRSGTLWVGCDQFLDRFDSVHGTFTHYPIDTGEVGNYVSEISQDRTGMLWLATGSGLFGLNPDTGHITHYVHDPANPSSLGSNQIRCTLEDRSGRFWVADGENLEEFDRESERVLSRVRLSEGIRAVSFYEDHLGVFWITYITSSEPFCIDPQIA